MPQGRLNPHAANNGSWWSGLTHSPWVVSWILPLWPLPPAAGVGPSLADRTPDSQGYPNVHHLEILKGELSRQFDLATVYGRVAMAHGEPVQLGEKRGSSTGKARNRRPCSAGRAANFLRSSVPSPRNGGGRSRTSTSGPW